MRDGGLCGGVRMQRGRLPVPDVKALGEPVWGRGALPPHCLGVPFWPLKQPWKPLRVKPSQELALPTRNQGGEKAWSVSLLQGGAAQIKP